MSAPISNVRPDPDKVLVDIVDYVLDYEVDSTLALDTARNCLIDTLGCGLEALSYPACTKLMGPIVPGTIVPNGARVPGTPFQLDPVQAAFNIGAMIRWLDFNDTWLAAEWGHPSDNLGGILATADWLSRNAIAAGKKPLTMKDVLTGMVKAHEIQGCIALENSFNKVGLDHVLLVKLASTAVVGQLIGLTRDELINAVSLAFVDGHSLRTYRHAPNTGSRKSWAAGDATSRAVRLALIAKTGEMGYPSVLTAKTWGFYDVLFKGNAFKFQRPYGSYVMENVLFKISFPAEFHSQTAVEAAMTLHAQLAKAGKRVEDIKKITIRTHEAAIRIIDKKGPLEQSRRPRSLHPVHDRRAADLRPPDRRRLRRLGRAGPAHRRAARQDGMRRRPAIHEGLLRSGEALDSECADRRIQRWLDVRRSRGRISDRTQASSRGWNSAAGREVQDQPRAPLPAKAATGDPRVSLDQARLEAMPVNEYVDLYVI